MNWLRDSLMGKYDWSSLSLIYSPSGFPGFRYTKKPGIALTIIFFIKIKEINLTNKFFQKMESNNIICNFCFDRCLIEKNNFGRCNKIENKDGEFINHNYNVLSHIMVENIEKKNLFHFFPGSKTLSIGSFGCNLKCLYCQNSKISQNDNIVEKIIKTPEEVVNEAIQQNVKSISFTYNEPTINIDYVIDVCELAKQKKLKTCMKTNGTMSYEVAEKLTDRTYPLLDAINIDFKSRCQSFYDDICSGGDIFSLKRIILMFTESSVWVEISTPVVCEENDSDDEIYEISSIISKFSRDIPYFLAPVYPANKLNCKRMTEKRMQELKKVAEQNLNYVYILNMKQDENTYCKHCKTTLVERHFMKTDKILFDVKKDYITRCPFCDFSIDFKI